MKAVILAGGLGTRLSEETSSRPKPMVEIGGRPILWHILKIYSQHGINDFIICCGYKGYLIKEYFANYFLHMSDVTFDMRENRMQVHQSVAEPWHVTLVDTGDNAGTGGRLQESCIVSGGRRGFLHDLWRRCKRPGYLRVDRLSQESRQTGDGDCGAADSPLWRPRASMGRRSAHSRKSRRAKADGSMAASLSFPRRLWTRYPTRRSMFEREPMESLTSKKQVQAFFHNGFWQPMDTLRDKQRLEELWASGRAPWKTW